MATAKIRQATSASTSTLLPELPSKGNLPNGTLYDLELVAASALSSQAGEEVYSLFDSNMSQISSTSSFPYTEKSKKEELFDPSARYIIARIRNSLERSNTNTNTEVDNSITIPGSYPDNLTSTSTSTTEGETKARIRGKGKGKGKARETEYQYDLSPGELLGYCSFRFDTEETLSSRDAEVIYCYELQLVPIARRTGLAKRLLGIMEDIGKRRGMDKSMLTCLKSNTTALAFYKKQGYAPDEIDPTRMAEEEEWEDEDEIESEDDEDKAEADYVILSKSFM